LRVLCARVGARGKGFICEEVMIRQRPAEAADRAVPSHWEGDLIIGTGRSAIGTLVERSSRFHLAVAPAAAARPRRPARQERTGRHRRRGRAVRDAIAAQLAGLPEHLRRSLTWDKGAELAQHARLQIYLGLQVYFCDPQSPWQRGTNENTNGLLRQYCIVRELPSDGAGGDCSLPRMVSPPRQRGG
jgi:IS30 family transposase